MKTILMNVLKAVGILLYFLILMYATRKMDITRLAVDIKYFSVSFLIIGIIVIESAYRKDSGMLAISGIELLVIAFYSLTMMHLCTLFKYDLDNALIISGVVSGGYYLIKGIILHIRERKELLKNLSDISDIVKKDEPVIKEAKKREKPKKEAKSEETKTKEVKPENTKTKETKNKTKTKKPAKKTAKKTNNKKRGKKK